MSLPAGAREITQEDLLAVIGELYVQVRTQRLVILAQQQQAANVVEKSEHLNGTLEDAVRR